MNTEWSLECLYQGYDDPEFEKDMNRLQELACQIKDSSSGLSGQSAGDMVPYLLGLLEDYYETMSGLDIYVSLRSSTNTADKETKAWEERIMQINSSISGALAGIERYFAGVQDLELIEPGSPLVKEYDFYLREKKREAAHMLSNEAEEIISRMNLSGGAAWANLQE